MTQDCTGSLITETQSSSTRRAVSTLVFVIRALSGAAGVQSKVFSNKEMHRILTSYSLKNNNKKISRVYGNIMARTSFSRSNKTTHPRTTGTQQDVDVHGAAFLTGGRAGFLLRLCRRTSQFQKMCPQSLAFLLCKVIHTEQRVSFKRSSPPTGYTLLVI